MDDKNYKSDKKGLCNNAAEIEPKKKTHKPSRVCFQGADLPCNKDTK